MSERPWRAASPALACVALFGLLSFIVAADFSADSLRMSPIEARVARKLAVAEAELGKLASCRDSNATALAIVAGESALRNPVETLVEDVYAAIAARAGLPALGVSFGPAQIGAAHYSATLPGDEGYWTAVTDRCATLEFVQLWLARRRFDLAAPRGRAAAFSAWSGHAEPQPGVPHNPAVSAYFAFMENVHRMARSGA